MEYILGTRKLFVFITVFSVLACFSGQGARRREYYAKMEKVWCDFSPKVFRDTYCAVKANRDQRGRFTLRGYILDELKTLNGLFEVKDAIVQAQWIPSALANGVYRMDTYGVDERGYVGAMKFYFSVSNSQY